MSTFGIILAVLLVVIGVLAIHAITHLLWLFLVGLVVGGLGRLALRGTRDVGLIATGMLGIGGSLIGGVITKRALHHHGRLVELAISVLCAAVLLALFTRRSAD